MTITPAEITKMTDNEIGQHLSGGLGAAKRNAMLAAIRDMAARLSK